MRSAIPVRIHEVAKRTGVPEPTLRAWERRYGVPSPHRTKSGYRLYGAAEIEQVLAMRELCEKQGMAASDAARIVIGTAPPADDTTDPFETMHQQLVEAALAYDAASIDELLQRLSFMGSTTNVFDRAIAPALQTIGDRWHSGQADVAQEHLFSRRVQTFLRGMLQLSRPDSGPCVVMACIEDELHEIGLLALAARFASWGYRPIDLGASTPARDLRGVVRKLAPAAVVLSITMAPPASRAPALLRDYKAACGRVPLLVGGRGAVALDATIRKAGAVRAPSDPDALRQWMDARTRGR